MHETTDCTFCAIDFPGKNGITKKLFCYFGYNFSYYFSYY
jgi:hypothetical protein